VSALDRLDAQRSVGWISILSFPLCLVAIYTILAAVGFDAELGYLPVEAIPVVRGELVFAWGFFDFLGYYLLRVPLILFLWRWLRPRNPLLVDVATLCALFYVLLAVVATSIMTGATTGILELYADADASLRSGLEAAWGASIAAVRRGLWHFMLLPWSVFAWAMGGLLASEARWLGRSLQLVGVAASIGVVAPFFPLGVESVLALADEFQVHFMPLWMVWAGVVLLRGPGRLDAECNEGVSFP
jgi:hypothetical protein